MGGGGGWIEQIFGWWGGTLPIPPEGKTLIIIIHILPSISRSQGNQTIKYGQLIEYNMRNIFLEKLYTKHGAEASPRTFYKKSKLRISLD